MRNFAALLLSAFLGLITLPHTAFARGGGAEVPKQDPATIDDVVESFMRRQRVPACSVAVGRSAGLVYAQGYGTAAPGMDATPETVYRVGSLTKQFTAALALLVSQKSETKPFDIDVPVQKFFPRRKQWAGITLRNLLNHTSGIPTYTATREFRFYQFRPIKHDALMKRIGRYKQDFKPGTRGYYSNTNYLLLADALERHTGKSYEELLRERIFGPLGMSVTARISPKAPGDGFARGTVNRHFITKRTHPDWTLGVGDLQSSVRDLAKWNMALLGKGFLPQNIKEEMFTSVEDNPEPAVKGEKLAMGWMDISDGGSRRYYHQGYVHGFSAINYVVDPFERANRFVTVLCNAHVVEKMPELAARLARMF